VLFAHGSGSGRHSPRNRHVARLLNEGNLVTLLVDLLTPDEEAIDLQTAHLRFDIELLAERLVDVTEWLAKLPETRDLRSVTLAPAPAPAQPSSGRRYVRRGWVRSSLGRAPRFGWIGSTGACARTDAAHRRRE
jgi:hypothetical protein